MFFRRVVNFGRDLSAAQLLFAGLLCLLVSGTVRTAVAQPNVQALRSVKVIDLDESGADLRFPSGIAYDREGDELYVTSPQKNKLVVMTPDYFPYLSIGSGRGLNSISKSYIKDSLLYVCLGASMTEPRPHIAVFDMAFMPVRQIFFPDFATFSPLALVVGQNDRLYVVGMNGTGVMVLNNTGEFLHWIEPKDEVLEVSEKAPILALDIGLDGRLYFLSEAMGRVYVYSPAEKFLYKFGEKGGEPGKLSRPRGIAVDDLRRQVYLVDYQRHTMSLYSMAGEYLFEVGGMGGGRGWFYYPSDLVVDGQGRIVVADTFNHRLQVFEFISNRGYGADTRPDLPTDRPVVSAESIDVVVEPEIADVIRIRSLKQPLESEQPGDFVVVTGLDQQKKNAEDQQLQLARKGYPAQVQALDLGKSGVWHQVFVGPYQDPLEAYEVAEKIRTEEQLPAILKTRGKPQELQLPRVEAAEAEDKTTAATVLQDLQPDSAAPLDGQGEKIFPSIVLPVWSDSPQADKVVEPLPLQPESEPLPVPIETPVLKNAKPAATAPAPAEKPAAVKSEVVQSSDLRADKAVTSPAKKLPQAVDYCVECHTTRIAKVCLACHPKARKDRMAGEE